MKFNLYLIIDSVCDLLNINKSDIAKRVGIHKGTLYRMAITDKTYVSTLWKILQVSGKHPVLFLFEIYFNEIYPSITYKGDGSIEDIIVLGRKAMIEKKQNEAL